MLAEYLKLAEGISAITPDRLANMAKYVEQTKHLPGEIAELGVYRGGSAIVIAEIAPHKMLHLFDTFEGLPYSENLDYDPEGHAKKGMFACSADAVLEFMRGRHVTFHVGLFDDRKVRVKDLCFSFVHVDCDLGDTAKQAIEWFWPRMVDGGVMFFDDYGCEFTGVTNAVNQAFKPEKIELQYDMYGNRIGAAVEK